MDEVLARLDNTKWEDPRGKTQFRKLTHTFDPLFPEQVMAGRDTVPQQAGRTHLDKVLLTFTHTPRHPEILGCTIEACSESQSTTVTDGSTNYCNIYNLISGSDAGIDYVNLNLNPTFIDVNAVPGSGTDKSKCKVVDDIVA